MPITLNPALDVAAITEHYGARKRGQIRDVLTADSADAIHAMLQTLPWGIAFNRGEEVVELDAVAVSRLAPDEARHMMADIHAGAQSGYQFVYAYYPLLRAYFSVSHPRIPLFDVFEFMNSVAMLDLARDVTGLRDIRWADGQATLFRAGHFLKYHTDETPAQRRLAAYVLNLTPGWGRDWGGYLQFFNDRYDVEEAYRPVFNALNIFTIPADHSVSAVAAYAPGNRYSITGWFRGDDPPGPIGVA